MLVLDFLLLHQKTGGPHPVLGIRDLNAWVHTPECSSGGVVGGGGGIRPHNLNFFVLKNFKTVTFFNNLILRLKW